ncbi:hypothetical protein [Candidatus Methanarcanum hacksteinii]|uniref:hypothetical protein n=1 Tax=Candidatus Methanarcanum hacksteinii TaxID=2911857 RepID=UPI0037DD15B8
MATGIKSADATHIAWAISAGCDYLITTDGRTIVKDVRPLTESMVWSLGHLTLTRIVSKGKRKEAYFSNWDGISREVFANIRAEIGCKAPVFG